MIDERGLVAEALPAYEIMGELGRGGWGVVLEGRHRQLDRPVAIKQLPRAFGADADVQSRFLAEARLLASLDHPHIVPVYDFVERDGLCVLVMEKLTGGTVWRRFTTSGVHPEEACGIGCVAAVALEHAHRQGILHRDVKPDNLMFSGSGVVKVTDFGIAKVLSGPRTMGTRAGDILGTPEYMAPEQAQGHEVGPATDVYALGVTLYQLLSGALPYPGPADSAVAVLLRHVTDVPVDLAVAAPAVPGPVAEVVMRSLRKDPAERFATAEAFGVALATAASASFGPGWLARRGMAVMAGGPVAAAAESGSAAAAGAPPESLFTPVVATLPPRRADAVPAPIPEPGELVPVDEAAAELRERDAREQELLEELQYGPGPFRLSDGDEARRLLGGRGTDAKTRLGVLTRDEVHAAAVSQHARWQTIAESPLSSRRLADAARVLVRLCERLAAASG